MKRTKKIRNIVTSALILSIICIITVSARDTRDIGALFIDVDNVQQNVDFSRDYTTVLYDGILTEKYTKGNAFSNAKVTTSAPTYCRNYTHVMAVVRDASQRVFFTDDDIIGDDSRILTVSVSASEDTPIYTIHFCEVWENEADECLYWIYDTRYVSSAPSSD